MQLSSTAFSDGTAIPSRYTCDGEDISPPLSWKDSPTGTRSFVLLCDDHDAPGGTWHHWAAYDIPANLTSPVPGAAQRIERLAFKQAVNDFQNIGYGGPCPPPEHGLHHYNFRLLALSVDRLAVGKKPSCLDVAREARKHVLTEATVVGVYER
ncbi:MAG: YbhB/YbcL family Raf kinase inhibitor-like protein [Pseudolabrys sp.]|nr:YbhB/YbcL family Raf kinase inhibitor-like protein [Pseudolabrys sp.]MDP2297947.1 YbhB/YbcL family Raf kinase inhibitor-like protein [Pseudolabrys sp.]